MLLMASPLSAARAADTPSEPTGTLPIGADSLFRARMLSWDGPNQAAAPSAPENALPVAKPRITSGFGQRTDPVHGGHAHHAGVDLAAAPGERIHASAAGRVAIAAFAGGYGKLVTIRHADGLESRYAHLSRILVAPGDRVAAGQIIGEAGSTGRSTGSHLHYEVRRLGRAVDPISGGHSDGMAKAATPRAQDEPRLSNFARAQE